MISQSIQNRLNRQIEMEGFSSQFYLAMAAWAEKQGYQGTSNFLYRHSDEERAHMLKLFHYINDRGGVAIVPPIAQPPLEFESLPVLFGLLLEHEIKVTEEINNIVDECLNSKDYTTYNFMQWYVSEQIEEERLARDILDKMKLIGNDKGGLYLFDRDLQTMAVTMNH